jgi:hypothetical protein
LNNDLPLETARIRGLQEIHREAHAALQNWGWWSLDRRGIYPHQTGPSIYGGYRSGDYDEEELDLDPERLEIDAKAEAAPRQPYDGKSAEILDERLHHAGGPSLEVRRVLRIVYVSHEIPEYQMPRMAGCTLDAFCERLEAALRFTRRFI